MEYNFNEEKYDKIRKWISERYKKGETYDSIRHFFDNKNFEELKDSLNWNDDITLDAFYSLVVHVEKDEQERILIIKEGNSAMINSGKDRNCFKLMEEDDNSCWCNYRNLLKSKEFHRDTIEIIKSDTQKILNQLSFSNEGDVVKGLVMGYVQSGKTSSMESLITAAADSGTNLFIILTGIIKNLLIQNKERMIEDLIVGVNPNSKCKLEEVHFKDNKTNINHLDLRSSSNMRYICFCLKQKYWLEQLNKWLNKSKNKKNLKLLIIDDEADQASINVKDISSDERTKINNEIVKLIDDEKKEFGNKNYIGYTATPYANVLNEQEGLYPSNFISLLGENKEYFGAKQIFGMDTSIDINMDENELYPGMDMIINIDDHKLYTRDQIKIINRVYSNPTEAKCESLDESICWFVCVLAVFKFYNMVKTVSMLIHTSPNVGMHDKVDIYVNKFFDRDRFEIISLCKEVYNRETRRFTIEKLQKQYFDYKGNYAEINAHNYPSFEEIENIIGELLDISVSRISLQDDEITYNKGIHICIDNSGHTGITEENEHFRLIYPSKDKLRDDIKESIGFIVIGGNTLSRGLTLENLVSSYFLRSTSAADTLMQMGRWFGYRKGYEIYPRIWMTSKTRAMFKYLVLLEEELRGEVLYMAQSGRTPEEYAPRVKTSYGYTSINITAKNKMQSAEKCEIDLSGHLLQTFKFDDDENILKGNYEQGLQFITKLNGNYSKSETSNGYVWRDVNSDTIVSFISQYTFNKRMTAISDKEMFLEYLKNNSDTQNNWNVVFAGVKNGNIHNFVDLKIKKVSRTKFANDNTCINIGVLTNPMDLIADIEDKYHSTQTYKDYESSKAKRTMKRLYELRTESGVAKTPLLILYLIDKDSTPAKDSENRSVLATDVDILGLAILLPGMRAAGNCATYVSMKKSIILEDGENMEDE